MQLCTKQVIYSEASAACCGFVVGCMHAAAAAAAAVDETAAAAADGARAAALNPSLIHTGITGEGRSGREAPNDVSVSRDEDGGGRGWLEGG